MKRPTRQKVKKQIKEQYNPGDEFSSSEFLDNYSGSETRKTASIRLAYLAQKGDLLEQCGKVDGKQNKYKVRDVELNKAEEILRNKIDEKKKQAKDLNSEYRKLRDLRILDILRNIAR